MRYLIDTHILMWMLYEPERLTHGAHKILSDKDARLHISIVSFWEIIIKASRRKYPLSERFLDEVMDTDIELEDLSLSALNILRTLPHHHADPFDRMLIAQAISGKLHFITHDQTLLAYEQAKIILA